MIDFFQSSFINGDPYFTPSTMKREIYDREMYEAVMQARKHDLCDKLPIIPQQERSTYICETLNNLCKEYSFACLEMYPDRNATTYAEAILALNLALTAKMRRTTPPDNLPRYRAVIVQHAFLNIACTLMEYAINKKLIFSEDKAKTFGEDWSRFFDDIKGCKGNDEFTTSQIESITATFDAMLQATPSPDDSPADEAETTPPEPSTASASTPMESSEAAGTATASPDDSPILSKYPARVTAEIHERLERANILTIEKGKYKWTGKNKNKLAYILLCLYYGESNPKEWDEERAAPAQYIASFCPDIEGLARAISKAKSTIKNNIPKPLEGVKRVFEYSVQAEEERQKDERMKRLNLDIEKTDLKFPIKR